MASVLITGTSKGIGFEAALAFGRVGHQVFATMRNPAQAPALAEAAAKEKLPILISTMDVDSDASVQDAIAAILKSGPIDVLVNNAGVEAVGSVEELPLSAFRSVMETNYFGVAPLHSGLVSHPCANAAAAASSTSAPSPDASATRHSPPTAPRSGRSKPSAKASPAR